MATLVVRNVDEEVVRALKAAAELEGISAEAKHRKILEAVLLKPKKKTLVEVLRAIPSVANEVEAGKTTQLMQEFPAFCTNPRGFIRW